MENKAIRTFLSANSASGFFSFFDELNDFENVYVLKGGPGTGKSSFMRRVASASLAANHFSEHVYCSSDPDSLDAVCIGDLPLAVCDGTPPHLFEPKCIGACGGLVDLGEYWDESELKKNAEDIRYLGARISECYRRAYSCLSAAGSFLGNIRNESLKAVDRKKIDRFAQTFISKNIPQPNGKKAKLRKRFLTGITPKGIVTFADTLPSLCPRVHIVSDRFFVSDLLLEKLLNAAVDAGFDAYAFYSPLMPSVLRCFAVPELDFAFASSDLFSAFEPLNTKNINGSRFFVSDLSDADHFREDAAGLRLSLRAAENALRTAKKLHDDLEEIYIPSMDFDTMQKRAKDFCKKYIR